MNIFEQLDQINDNIRQSYCNHDYLVQTDDPILKDLKIEIDKDLEAPVVCFDCHKVLECQHDDTEAYDNHLYCLCCGKEIIVEREW